MEIVSCLLTDGVCGGPGPGLGECGGTAEYDCTYDPMILLPGSRL